MKDVDCLLKLHRVDRTVGVGVEVLDDLKHTRAPKAFERLGVGMLATTLSFPQSVPDLPSRSLWEVAEVVQ